MKYQEPLNATHENTPYIDADYVNDVSGSIVPPKAVEKPMRELVHVIEYFKQIPDEKKTDQIAQVFKKIMAGVPVFDDRLKNTAFLKKEQLIKKEDLFLTVNTQLKNGVYIIEFFNKNVIMIGKKTVAEHTSRSGSVNIDLPDKITNLNYLVKISIAKQFIKTLISTKNEQQFTVKYTHSGDFLPHNAFTLHWLLFGKLFIPPNQLTPLPDLNNEDPSENEIKHALIFKKVFTMALIKTFDLNYVEIFCFDRNRYLIIEKAVGHHYLIENNTLKYFDYLLNPQSYYKEKDDFYVRTNSKFFKIDLINKQFNLLYEHPIARTRFSGIVYLSQEQKLYLIVGVNLLVINLKNNTTKTIKPSTNHQFIHLTKLSSGIYFIEFITQRASTIKKIDANDNVTVVKNLFQLAQKPNEIIMPDNKKVLYYFFYDSMQRAFTAIDINDNILVDQLEEIEYFYQNKNKIIYVIRQKKLHVLKNKQLKIISPLTTLNFFQKTEMANGIIYCLSTDQQLIKIDNETVTIIIDHAHFERLIPVDANSFLVIKKGAFKEINIIRIETTTNQTTDYKKIKLPPTTLISAINNNVYLGSMDHQLYKLNNDQFIKIADINLTGGFLNSWYKTIYAVDHNKQLYRIDAADQMQLISGLSVDGPRVIQIGATDVIVNSEGAIKRKTNHQINIINQKNTTGSLLYRDAAGHFIYVGKDGIYSLLSRDHQPLNTQISHNDYANSGLYITTTNRVILITATAGLYEIIADMTRFNTTYRLMKIYTPQLTPTDIAGAKITQDGEANLYLSTQQNTVHKIYINRLKRLSDGESFSAVAELNNTTYVIIDGGIYQINAQQFIFIQFILGFKTSKSYQFILFKPQTENFLYIYASSPRKIFTFNGTHLTEQPPINLTIKAFFELPDHTIIIQTNNNELKQYQANGQISDYLPGTFNPNIPIVCSAAGDVYVNVRNNNTRTNTIHAVKNKQLVSANLPEMQGVLIATTIDHGFFFWRQKDKKIFIAKNTQLTQMTNITTTFYDKMYKIMITPQKAIFLYNENHLVEIDPVHYSAYELYNQKIKCLNIDAIQHHIYLTLIADFGNYRFESGLFTLIPHASRKINTTTTHTAILKMPDNQIYTL